MQLLAFGSTDVGCVRDHNEDAYRVDTALGLYIVCDGMGGHAGGEVASSTAVQAAAEYVENNRDTLAAMDGSDESLQRVAEMLYRAVLHASQTVFQIACSDHGKHGMGTTLVALLTVGDKGVMVNVGDSRLYLVRDGQLAQLSTDHTYVNEALAAGLMTEEEAANSPHGHVLTRAVGTQASVRADVMAFDLLPRDTFLLCSDGLHDYTMDAGELYELLAADDVSEVPTALVQMARDGGGHDNITAVVVRVSESADREDTERRDAIVQDMDALGDIDLFRDLSTSEIVRLYGRLLRMEVEPGIELIREGDRTDTLYVLVDGELEVRRAGKFIASLGRGAHVGEMALLSARPRSATVTAVTHCSLLCLDRRHFQELMSHEPHVAGKFLLKFARALSMRLDDAYMARDFRRGQTTAGLGALPPDRDPEHKEW